MYIGHVWWNLVSLIPSITEWVSVLLPVLQTAWTMLPYWYSIILILLGTWRSWGRSRSWRSCSRFNYYKTSILFDGLTYKTHGYFASCAVFFRRGEERYEQWEKCPRALYVKPSNKRFIIPQQKRCYFASILCGKSVLRKMHHLSFRAHANDVKNTKSQPKIFIWLDKQNDEWQAMTS